MLIETPYKNGDVVTVRLSSGEELVTKLDNETDTTVSISKPLSAMMSEKGLAMLPFLMTVDPETKLTLNKNQITCIVKPVKEIADHYIQTTSGITLGV